MSLSATLLYYGASCVLQALFDELRLVVRGTHSTVRCVVHLVPVDHTALSGFVMSDPVDSIDVQSFVRLIALGGDVSLQGSVRKELTRDEDITMYLYDFGLDPHERADVEGTFTTTRDGHVFTKKIFAPWGSICFHQEPSGLHHMMFRVPGHTPESRLRFKDLLVGEEILDLLRDGIRNLESRWLSELNSSDGSSQDRTDSMEIMSSSMLSAFRWYMPSPMNNSNENAIRTLCRIPALSEIATSSVWEAYREMGNSDSLLTRLKHALHALMYVREYRNIPPNSGFVDYRSHGTVEKITRYGDRMHKRMTAKTITCNRENMSLIARIVFGILDEHKSYRPDGTYHSMWLLARSDVEATRGAHAYSLCTLPHKLDEHMLQDRLRRIMGLPRTSDQKLENIYSPERRRTALSHYHDVIAASYHSSSSILEYHSSLFERRLVDPHVITPTSVDIIVAYADDGLPAGFVWCQRNASASGGPMTLPDGRKYATIIGMCESLAHICAASTGFEIPPIDNFLIRAVKLWAKRQKVDIIFVHEIGYYRQVFINYYSFDQNIFHVTPNGMLSIPFPDIHYTRDCIDSPSPKEQILYYRVQ
jgi:hypothetical protein